MTVRGTIADINAALEGLRFDPTPGYAGSTTLSIAANDLGNAGAGNSHTTHDRRDSNNGNCKFRTHYFYSFQH